MIFRELSNEEFDKFAKNYIPNTYYQTSEYAKNIDYKTCFLGVLDNENIIAATLIIYQDNNNLRYGYAPRGFLIDYNNLSLLEFFTNELKKYLTKLNIVAIKLNPMIVRNIYNSKYELISSNPDYEKMMMNLTKLKYHHLGYNNYFESLHPRFEAIIPLTNNIYNMFGNMEKRVRTKTRSSEVKGVRIYKGKIEDIEELYNLANQKKNYNRLKKLVTDFNNDIDIYYAKLEPSIYLTHNQNLYLNQEKKNNVINDLVIKNKGKNHNHLLNQKIKADNLLNLYHERLSNAIKLVSKYPDGLIVAAIVVYKSKDMIYMLEDIYLEELKHLNAKNLLIWKLIEKYGTIGYNYLNLGGIVGKVDNSNKYYGLNHYKLGYGSNVYEYIGDLELVINKAKYIMYQNTAPIFKK